MVSWKAYSDVIKEIASLSNSNMTKVVTLYALSVLVQRGRTTMDMEGIEGLSIACPVSSYGENNIRQISASKYLTSDEISFLGLRRFYHRDMFVDVDKVDIDLTVEIIDKVIAKGGVIFPDRHGRDLYDKFNQTYNGQRIDFLSVEESEKLTDGMPNGVYQVGHLVVGPLGILASSEGRLLPPDKRIPLWHCADPGCGKIHLVELHNFKSKIKSADDELVKTLSDKEGPPSDWDGAFGYMSRSNQDGLYFDIIPFITDALDLSEKASLMEAALESADGKHLRDIISVKIDKRAGQGSSQKVSSQLTNNQIVQLISTLKSNAIINLLDKLVFAEKIFVPKSEVRYVQTLVPKRPRDPRTSMSSLGLRSAKKQPAAYLCSIVYDAYDRSGNLSDLAWRCKVKDPSASSVLKYMADYGPRTMIAELVRPSKVIYDHVCIALGLAPDAIPPLNQEDYFLWKAGFNVSRYEDYLSLFRSSITSFSDAVMSMPLKSNDIDREKIRAAAANCFVYAERFAEELVSFNAWYLTSDHFGDGRFEYRKKDALLRVSQVCGNPITVGGSTFHWSESGNNTLGALLVFGRALAAALDIRVNSDPSLLLRMEADYPHYATSRSKRFPFKHTELWADAEPDALSEYMDKYRLIISTLEKAKTAEVRNGIQHYRDKSKFPDKEVLMECANLLLRSLDMADVSNLIPKQHWVSSNSVDSFGISNWIMADYSGRSVEITLPSTNVGMIKPAFDRAYIVEGGSLLGQGETPLIFEHREASKFSNTWTNYQKTVLIEPADEEIGG